MNRSSKRFDQDLSECVETMRDGSKSFFAAYRDWETDRKSTRLNSSH